jgi:hypothetical protein
VSTVVVIGSAGQVGRGLVEALGQAHDVVGVDIGEEPQGVDRDVAAVHIAIGWSETFVQTVEDYEVRFRPGVVIVHSTVPPGTCDPNGWVHAPVRGRHPHLAEGIAVFPMHVGGVRADLAEKVLADAGIMVWRHARALECEAGKIVELAQLAVQVRVEKEIHALCAERGWNYDVVYGDFARTYNAGYSALERRFVRPVLRHAPGPLGGHCVAQNTPLLRSPFFDEMLDPISPWGWDGRAYE